MLSEEKKSLRARLRREFQGIPSTRLEYLSRRLLEAVEAHERFRKARVVMLFHPLPDEPDLRPLMERYKDTKTLLLPVVEGSEMTVRRYEGKDTLRIGAYGIFEPVGDTFARYADIDLVLVPGMAFTTDGRRLGRGGGYYDRFLSRSDVHAYTLGVCFPFRILDILPTDTNDVDVDEVVMTRGVDN